MTMTKTRGGRAVLAILLAIMTAVTFMPAMSDSAYADAMNDWITFNDEGVSYVSSDENADYYTAANAYEFNDENAIEIHYTVSGGQKKGHPAVRDANGNAVEGAAANEENALERTTVITGLDEDTAYQLYWKADADNTNLVKDVILNFTTAETESVASNTWITFGEGVRYVNSDDENDYYIADNYFKFDEEGKVNISYTVDGGKRYCAAQIRSEAGEAVEGAAATDPLDILERTVTVTGLAKETNYQLFWDKTQSNNKLQKNVILTFSTERPSNKWLTFPENVKFSSTTTDTDYYRFDSSVVLGTEPVTFHYTSDGGKKYGQVAVTLSDGTTPEGVVVEQPVEATDRTVTITGLQDATTYQLYWDKAGTKGNLSKNIVIIFNTVTPKQVVINNKTVTNTVVKNAMKTAHNEQAATITLGKNVKYLKKYAFKGTTATKVVVKTKNFTKSRVKGSLKSSKVKTVQVKVGSTKTNKKYVSKYKKYFTSKNAGRKVSVKR